MTFTKIKLDAGYSPFQDVARGVERLPLGPELRRGREVVVKNADGNFPEKTVRLSILYGMAKEGDTLKGVPL
jgi:hypothetical protein